ncbi:hypothetical protein C2G38_1358552 [Gigaspora rosea]|uniref:Uncharacterized protein n=1 Tax=Gigaspora rosea TaxID=44941 RepID=A0A397TUL0_9GLOM|nr:hypothetical protein C2G38_1358552 [Gigaspora rosea]
MKRYDDTIVDLTKLLDTEQIIDFALRHLGEVYHLTKETITDLAKLLGIELSDDINESLKKNLSKHLISDMCNNMKNIYTLEDLENLLEINQDTALKFRVKFNFTMERYEDAIVDLTKLLDIEQNNEAYHITGIYKDAIIDLKKLFGIVPSDEIDELLKKKWIETFNMCNNATNTFTLEDLENSLKIKQDSALKFRVKFNFLMERYKDAINDLIKLLYIKPNNKFALKYRAEAYYLMAKYKESFNDVNKLQKIMTNDEWASKLLTRIIENPCVDETYELGYFYLHRINLERNEYKAFTQFEKSANMGHTEGINCLGYCYEYGIGVEKNENKAFTYYQKSADMYNSDGMYQVGYCYYLGIGVEIDKHKAFTYYLKSAEAGNSMGIRKTAICYYYGIGVKKNKHKYYEWIEKE